MILMKTLGGGKSSRGRGAVEEAMLRQMMAMMHAPQGQEVNAERMEAMMRMVNMVDPKAALMAKKVLLDRERVGVEAAEVVEGGESTSQKVVDSNRDL